MMGRFSMQCAGSNFGQVLRTLIRSSQLHFLITDWLVREESFWILDEMVGVKAGTGKRLERGDAGRRGCFMEIH